MTEKKLTIRPRQTPATFLHSEYAPDIEGLKADIAFLGIPYGEAYNYADIVNDQTNAPAAMRAASLPILRGLERYDFDIGGTLYDGKPIRAVDCGDVWGDHLDLKAHVRRAEEAVRGILKAGALPIVLGGDHAIPIPVLRAFDQQEPLTLVQIDQHIDWRDEVNGVHHGLSSTMRRASEMSHIDEIFQIGLRATGSARTEEVEAARAYGAHLITAYELHDVGMDIVEITPKHDVNQITCITAGRLIVNLIGQAVRAGYFG